MQDILVVVDMQNDFIDGALGTGQAAEIVSKVAERIKGFSGKIYFTRDTHGENYPETQEGRKLPVKHCIRGTDGWQINEKLIGLGEGAHYEQAVVVDKPAFGSVELGEMLRADNEREAIRSVTLIGLCTDICVISNALLIKAFLPEAEIIVDAACCAGVTPESHRVALAAMKACQIRIENEE